ncbi:hypothetical protein VOLCADRAFT_98080, partial [Volvox carteri f. nagariensis]
MTFACGVKVLRVLVARTREDDVAQTWHAQSTLPALIRAAAAVAAAGSASHVPGPDGRVSELVNCRASFGVTPLILAAERDQVEAVKYLISVGADPWQGDNEGRNPAHYAAKAGAIKALQ